MTLGLFLFCYCFISFCSICSHFVSFLHQFVDVTVFVVGKFLDSLCVSSWSFCVRFQFIYFFLFCSCFLVFCVFVVVCIHLEGFSVLFCIAVYLFWVSTDDFA